MKKFDQQWQRLLRAAAAASRAVAPTPAPDAGWLLRQRERELGRTEVATRLLLRRGLAVVCLLLMATLLVSARQLGQPHEDVFGVSEMILTRISTP